MPGKTLKTQAQQFVLNLCEYFELEKRNGGPLEPLSSVQERIAAALKISRRTVYAIKKRKENNPILSSPGKSRPRLKAKTTDLPESSKMGIQNKINMANFLKAVTVILIGFYITLTEASPAQISKTIVDPSRCDHTLEDQNLPHDSDCSKYYRCVYGRKVPKICPETMLFNPEIGNCDLYYNVACPFKNMPEDEPQNELNLEEAIEHLTRKTFINKKNNAALDGEDKSTLDGENSITMTKPSYSTTTKFVYIPHESDQAAYYKIENGERNLIFCDEGMVFSIDLEICARPWVFE